MPTKVTTRVLAAFICFAASGAVYAAGLREEALPPAVQAAVGTNYQIGRRVWDSGGVASLRVFKVEGFTAGDLRSLLIAVQTATKDAGPSALAATCGRDPENDVWTPIVAADACAVWHMEENAPLVPGEARQSRRWLGRLYGRGGSEEADTHNAALDVIAQYLFADASRQYLELVSATDYFSVDVVTTVLIDAAAGVVYVLEMDAGA